MKKQKSDLNDSTCKEENERQAKEEEPGLSLEMPFDSSVQNPTVAMLD